MQLEKQAICLTDDAQQHVLTHAEYSTSATPHAITDLPNEPATTGATDQSTEQERQEAQQNTGNKAALEKHRKKKIK